MAKQAKKNGDVSFFFFSDYLENYIFTNLLHFFIQPVP